MTSCLFNYSPGPALLPRALHQQIQRDLGGNFAAKVPLLELGHRTPEFSKLANRSEQNLRTLLDIPDDYAVLFLPGGASVQYSAIPLNFLNTEKVTGEEVMSRKTMAQKTMDYVDTGHWSAKAAAEARRYGPVHIVAALNTEGLLNLPAILPSQYSNNAAYCHFVDNETLTGFELPIGFASDSMPGDRPAISDMTSNILSRRFDINQFGMVYAGTQKNIGIAGITVVIVHRELLDRAHKYTPSVHNYAVQAKAGSCYNTPPIFTWYVCDLMLEWTLQQGGIDEMERWSWLKSEPLYQYIDQSDIYANKVASRFRSRNNIHFHIQPTELETKFLREAEANGLYGLRGHRAVGGIRASLYNAMPIEGAQVLIEFMREFERNI